MRLKAILEKRRVMPDTEPEMPLPETNDTPLRINLAPLEGMNQYYLLFEGCEDY